jgi:hypothetical protein
MRYISVEKWESIENHSNIETRVIITCDSVEHMFSAGSERQDGSDAMCVYMITTNHSYITSFGLARKLRL